MVSWKRGVAGLLGSLLIGSTLLAVPDSAQPDGIRQVLAGDEWFQYKVKWLFIRLGTITVGTNSLPGHPDLYKTTITLDSNPDLFFISVHSRYEAVVSSDPVRCELFRSWEADGDDTLMTRYVFVDSLDRILMSQHMLPADTLVREEVKDSIDRFFDGGSLMLLARSLVHRDTSVSVPTLVDFDLFTTDITFTTAFAATSIGARDEDVRTRTLYGRANFGEKTIGGFSGEFKGWFSDDEAAVPILAEMSITLGTVNVELERWKRDGWEPPVHPEEP